MGGTSLHACILAQWFEMVLPLLLFFKDMLIWSSMGFYLVYCNLKSLSYIVQKVLKQSYINNETDTAENVLRC